jgi:diguanylate cyclase (GGDEF)-like protein/PAS domain S-box-containing protein
VILLGFVISLGLFYWFLESRDREVRQRFRELARTRAETLESKLSSYSSILDLVADYYDSTDRVDRYDFQSLTRGLLDRHEEISTIQWIRSVPDAKRSSYRSSLRDEGFDDPEITRADPVEGDRSSPESDRRFPVTYVEPTFPGQETKFIGFDYLSALVREKFLRRMTEKNVVSVLLNVAPLRSMVDHSDTSTPQNFVLLKPVYEGQHMMVKKRWDSLAGIISLEVSHEELMRTVFSSEESETLNLYVFGRDGSDDEKVLYNDGDGNRDLTPSTVKTWWSYERKVPLADQDLHLILNPSSSYRDEHRTAYPWVILAVGLGLTLLLGRASYRLSGEYLSQEKQFYSVFDSAPYAIATLDAQGRIQLWNQTARSMFGYSTNEARGTKFRELLAESEEDLEVLEEGDEPEGTEGFREAEARRRDGQMFPINLGVRGWTLQGRTFYTVMCEDITERKEYQQKIERMARRDDLTDLLNRATFMDKLMGEFERRERYNGDLSVVMIDVDHFKDINDIHGHLTGDEILESLALALKENTRKMDFVGRYGGEEFCVALPETEVDKAREMAERLRRTIEESEYVEDVTVTCSFGIAEYHEDVNDLDDLLARADEALYYSKENGRNQTTVWEDDLPV